ncbi:MAG: hypothetical protein FWF50_02820 [Defluviitaleaceae bacterium]|nr:hypothetical protein [Defluviitaleaceae bacterium]
MSELKFILNTASIKQTRVTLLSLAPHVEGLWKEVMSIVKEQEDYRASAASGKYTDNELNEQGLEGFKKMFDLVLNSGYEKIMIILSVLYQTSREKIEDQTVEQIYDMVLESLQNRALIAFFPRLKRLAAKTQLDI